MGDDEAADRFVDRWADRLVTERSQYQSFIVQLCGLIDVDAPDQRRVGDPDYAFEREVRFVHDDGSATTGWIDCYRRGCFVLEAKQSEKRKPGGEMAPVERRVTQRGKSAQDRMDEAMARALRQARGYAHALDEWPPFLVLMDVGKSIELWADFSGLGKAYSPFPDRRSYRIALSELRRRDIRERLRRVWTDPMSLDPSRRRTAVTTDIARDLSKLIASLEAGRRTDHAGGEGTRSRHVALYVLQCTFAMFAQDIGALADRAFDQYVELFKTRPERFHHGAEQLFGLMNLGGFSDTIQADIRRFNGGLFKERPIVRMTAADLQLLARIARHDWKDVEPSIFGSLLEQALSADERGRLGAHFTPRGHVERLILPTIIEPLRLEWEAVLATALPLAGEGRLAEARRAVAAFHHRLCGVRVLDPACGTGNFLYVAMAAMQDLEEEVLSRLAALGQTQESLGLEGHTISPEQFWGLEINPMSAWIAEMMLWIGYLQRQFQRHGRISASDPILKAFGTIQCRDALISRTRETVSLDEAGAVVQRWDRGAMSPHPVTGELIPDPRRQRAIRLFVDPRRAEWPEVHFIVGNPPFNTANRLRELFGDGYVEALRETHDPALRGADLAMYWWDRAAEILTQPKSVLRRFGFITSNSIAQSLSRKVVQRRLEGARALSLVYAMPDESWRAGGGQAAVRIAMTVAEAGRTRKGRLVRRRGDSYAEQRGVIGPQLTLARSPPARLAANQGLAFRGVCVGGEGFWLPQDVAADFRGRTGAADLVRPIVNGRDLTGRPRDAWVIDAFGLDEGELRATAPDLYHRLLLRVKPHRDVNARAVYRDRWWVFAEPRPELRAALDGLSHQIVTPMTAKHRTFQFLPTDVVADQGLVSIASEDAYVLGVLSSRPHLLWSRTQGGTLEDRPRYNNSTCFETFPWPDPGAAGRAVVAQIAEELDAARKTVLRARPDLTMTTLYNLRDKAAAGTRLTAKESEVFDAGRVGLIGRLHEQLDEEVLRAYGWRAQSADEQVLQALFQLNAERAGSEGAGGELSPFASMLRFDPRPAAVETMEIPDNMQVLLSDLLQTLRHAGRPLPEAGLAGRFKGAGARRKVRQALDRLSVAGAANHLPDGRWFTPDRAA